MAEDDAVVGRSPPLDKPLQLVEDWLQEHAVAAADGDADDAAAQPHDRIRAHLAEAHEADIADLLERLPPSARAIILGHLSPAQIGEVFGEVSDHLLESLVQIIPTDAIVSVLQTMASDDVGALMRELPKNVAARLMRLAELAENIEVRATLSFSDDTVGALMDYQPVLARETDRVGSILTRLRRNETLPPHCDKLFIVDDWERLTGVLPLKRLILNPPDAAVVDIMVSENIHSFGPDDGLDKASGAFERYDLISAPVVDDNHKIIGRVTIDELFAQAHTNRNRELLTSAGVSDEEDLFAPLWRRFGNRWRWLFVNLVAVFIISRVVSLFETTIVQLVALASLMPIVAGMSGNVGNQTATLTVRALALGQLSTHNWRALLVSEISLALINGVLWGGVVGAFAYALYHRVDLAVVLTLSMTLCFLSGALTGFAVPVLMQRWRRDPALGTTVVVSAVTDTVGFFIFLALAAFFLIT